MNINQFHPERRLLEAVFQPQHGMIPQGVGPYRQIGRCACGAVVHPGRQGEYRLHGMENGVAPHRTVRPARRAPRRTAQFPAPPLRTRLLPRALPQPAPLLAKDPENRFVQQKSTRCRGGGNPVDIRLKAEAFSRRQIAGYRSSSQNSSSNSNSGWCSGTKWVARSFSTSNQRSSAISSLATGSPSTIRQAYRWVMMVSMEPR